MQDIFLRGLANSHFICNYTYVNTLYTLNLLISACDIDDYGTSFVKYQNHRLIYNGIDGYPKILTVAECKAACRAASNCKSFCYIKTTGKCVLKLVTALENPSDFFADDTRNYFQKTCN